MLYYFLFYNEESAICVCVYIKDIPYIYIYIYIYIYTHIYISPPFRPTPHPCIPPLQVVTERRADLPGLYGKFPLASYFTHGGVFMSNLISQFSPTPTSMHLFSTSVSLFLSQKQIHPYYVYGFHIHVSTNHLIPLFFMVE